MSAVDGHDQVEERQDEGPEGEDEGERRATTDCSGDPDHREARRKLALAAIPRHSQADLERALKLCSRATLEAWVRQHCHLVEPALLLLIEHQARMAACDVICSRSKELLHRARRREDKVWQELQRLWEAERARRREGLEQLPELPQ